jgi:hypothetical protein
MRANLLSGFSDEEARSSKSTNSALPPCPAGADLQQAAEKGQYVMLSGPKHLLFLIENK